MATNPTSSTASNFESSSSRKVRSDSPEFDGYEPSEHHTRFIQAGYYIRVNLDETANNHFINLTPALFPDEYRPVIDVLAHHSSLKHLLSRKNHFCPKRLVTQFWKSAEYDASINKVVGYVTTPNTQETAKIHIGRASFQTWFDIPKRIDLGLKEYAANPTDAEILEFIQFIGYAERLAKRTAFKRKMLPKKWNVLFSILNKCLTGKVGSSDQGSYQVFAIMYGVYYGLNLDYAGLILSEFTGTVDRYTRQRVSGKVKTSRKKKDGSDAPIVEHLIFPRFLGVIIGGVLAQQPQFLSGGPMVKIHELTSVVPQTGSSSGEYELDRPLSKKMLGLLDRQTRRDYTREFRHPRPMPKTPPRVGAEVGTDVEVRLSEEEIRELRERGTRKTQRERGREMADRGQDTHSPEHEREVSEEPMVSAKMAQKKRKLKNMTLGGSSTQPKKPKAKRLRKLSETQQSEATSLEGGSSAADMDESGPAESVHSEHLSPIQEETHEETSDPHTIFTGAEPVTGSERTLPAHILQATPFSGGSALAVVNVVSEEEEERELEEEELLELFEKRSKEETDLELGGSYTHPSVQTDAGLDLAGTSGQDPSLSPTHEPLFSVEQLFAQFVHSRSEPFWVPQHTLHFSSEETFRTVQRGLEKPLKDIQGIRAEDSESSDSEGTGSTGRDSTAKQPESQGHREIPEGHISGEGGATSPTGQPGSGSTFLTEDKYQSLVEKIDQNLSTFNKATELFQNTLKSMTDSFKTISEEVKNQSSRIENLEEQFRRAQQSTDDMLNNTTTNLASDILAKAIENLTVPFDKATAIAKSLEEATRVPLITEESLQSAISKITKASERRLKEEFDTLRQLTLKQVDTKIDAQVSKFDSALAKNTQQQQREFSGMLNTAKSGFLREVKGSLLDYISGPLIKHVHSELTGVSNTIIDALNRRMAQSASAPQQFAAASTEQQKGESSKATEVAEESRRQKEAAEKARAEADAKERADRAEFLKTTARVEESTGGEPTTRGEPEGPIEIASDSSSSESADSIDRRLLSERIKNLQAEKQHISRVRAETVEQQHQTSEEESEEAEPLKRQRTEPEGSTPADDQQRKREEEKRMREEQRRKEAEEKRKQRGKSRVDEVTEKMETLKKTPPKHVSELQREFPERIYSHLYSQGREYYSYFTLFPVNKTEAELEYISKVIKDRDDVFTAVPIKFTYIPEVKVSTTAKGILNVKFKVIREDNLEYKFSDVDLLNLCPYDLHDLYGIMFNHEHQGRRFGVAKRKILEAMRDVVRMNARKDFELALLLGLDQTDLNAPDEDLDGLDVTEPYLPVPEVNGMSYLNEEGEIKLFKINNAMKYSSDTIRFLYNELLILNRRLTPAQAQTKESLIECFKGQLNYRRHIMILVSILKSIKEEAKILERMLAEKPIFDRP